ncbi:enoyl-CoA hydratase [Cupriavidus sp. HMR-1]|uniref:enoyl-CoA hydratase n=1 Tax=Cupriavidus sp. HMR-1 TaxID=1249621 RepID=UPI0002A295B1|nr:enoyl-CoA hydratase [Cupriavidus sp. HMR-1]EKZ97958.1 enoyl-CoA hydratase [Cupriavidus sp. HMR-1]
MNSTRILEGEITDALLVEKRGNTGWITFNDPGRHNAVSFDMWAAVPKALAAFEQDDDIRAVVLTGAGERAFVSGANISQFDKLRSGDEAVAAYEQVAEAAQLALYDYAKPTLARIKGYCIGGGMNIALCCDIRIASADSTFAIPAGKLGLGYRLTAIRNLVTTVGAANALEIFLTANRYAAAEAKALGLIHHVTDTPDAADLDAALQVRLDQIAGNAPLTLRAGKRMIRQLQQLGPEVDIAAMQQLVMQCFASDDYREGKRAFAEKRSPVFTGT